MTNSSTPLKYSVGDRVVSTCDCCLLPLVYEWRGKPMKNHPECLKKKYKGKTRQYNPNLKLGTEELVAQSLAGLAQLAQCSQAEAALKLAIWEELEKAVAGDKEAFLRLLSGEVEQLKPITHQAVQQIERRAIGKLRKKLGKDWEEYKESEASRTGVHQMNGGYTRAMDQWT